MGERRYWLDLFTWTTWQEFLDAGATVSGFRERRWKVVQKVRPGDYFLCYLTGVSRWIGLVEVMSEAFRDNAPIWKDGIFPCRVGVKLLVALEPDTAVPVLELRDRLSIFQNLKSLRAWTGRFRRSPSEFPPEEGKVIVEAIREAEKNPVIRPVDHRKLQRGAARERGRKRPRPEPTMAKPSGHDEVQWLLLKLGGEMGFDLWVARNDRNRIVDGQRFADLPRMRAHLPRQFDDRTQQTIELIDVLWLRGNQIVAAFEIEHTTSVYSGLLRMSDLLAMQPNLNIPLYLVAPAARRDRVMTEVNRPTFSRLSPPLSRACRFVSFSGLRDGIEQHAGVLRYLKPEFLDDLSEPCATVGP
jgi:hypothetical protein